MRLTTNHMTAVVLVFLFAIAGCASSGDSSSSGNRNLLTAEELAGEGGNLFEVIDRLRPQWLQTRGAVTLSGAPAQVLVYMNRSYVGGVEELRSFTVPNVVRIRYMDGTRAASTLTGYPSTIAVGGAIIMETSGRED